MSSKHHWLALALAALLTAPAVLADDKPFDSLTGETRLEQRTPAGRVPPPPAVAPRTADLGAEQPSITEDSTVDGSESARADEVVQQFRTAYRRAGSPRLAVYFNRALSDEVREWVPGDHVQAEVQVQHSVSGTTVAGGPVSSQGATNARADIRSRQYVGSTGGREDPREAWKWEFEDAITNLFLQGNANVVDRAMIFRQMAKHAPQTAGMDGSTSTTLNEISALDKFADVLVEMQVTRSKSGLGYDFRATAKNVKTGRILGSAFVKGSENENSGKHRYVATSSGYQKEAVGAGLTVEGVSRALTLKLMQSLTPQLGR